jgi:Tfp pilus assembly protein PilV
MSTESPNAPRIRWQPLADEKGLTLLEVMIAALILLFVLLSMISGYNMGRINLDREEVKRRAIALAQDRMETIRARAMAPPVTASFNAITTARIDTTYTLDGNTFTLRSTVNPLPSATNTLLKEITMDVTWTVYEKVGTSTRGIRIAGCIARDVSPN